MTTSSYTSRRRTSIVVCVLHSWRYPGAKSLVRSSKSLCSVGNCFEMACEFQHCFFPAIHQCAENSDGKHSGAEFQNYLCRYRSACSAQSGDEASPPSSKGFYGGASLCSELCSCAPVVFYSDLRGGRFSTVFEWTHDFAAALTMKKAPAKTSPLQFVLTNTKGLLVFHGNRYMASCLQGRR